MFYVICRGKVFCLQFQYQYRYLNNDIISCFYFNCKCILIRFQKIYLLLEKQIPPAYGSIRLLTAFTGGTYYFVKSLDVAYAVPKDVVGNIPAGRLKPCARMRLDRVAIRIEVEYPNEIL